MTSSTPPSCAVTSVKFEDIDSLLQHMAAPAHITTPSQQGSARKMVLSRTAFLRLKPLLQQSAGRGLVTIVTRGGPPPEPTAPTDPLEVGVLEPSEPVIPWTSGFDPDSVECCVCRRKFKHKYSLVAHCRLHLMSRLCGVCHARLPDGQALVDHLETHMEKNPTFKCDQCDKSFMRAKNLYLHKRNHLGVRPFTCQHCQKTFIHRHKLREHVRFHTGEKPYHCDVCGWGFPRNEDLKRHVRTHVGTKPFHCLDCGVGCGTQVAMIRHGELHHGKTTRTALW